MSSTMTSSLETELSKSETCMSIAIEEFVPPSLPNLTAAGIISYMNCVGIGLPFLTYNFKVNKQFLARHNLKIGKIYLADNPAREILVDAIQEFGSQLEICPVTPGGIGLDVARITQWLLPQPKTVAFLGARSVDEDAHTLRDLYRNTRLGIRMEEVATARTGVLLVAHYKKLWCEIFFIDNMATISPAFIDKPIVTKMLERANMVYLTELSVWMNPKVTQMIAYYTFSRFKHCLLILHREHFLADSKDILLEVLTCVDIVFLTKKQRYRCCAGCSSSWDIYSWLKDISKKSSVVIVSNGLNTAYIHTDLNTGMSARFKSRFTRRSKAVDYYGGARAFVAGFMAMMIRGYQLDPCVECGFFCASLIVSRIGVQIPVDEAVLNRWYILLDHILQQKICERAVKKRESNMPFTMFQTPWKEKEVNDVFAVSFKTSPKHKEVFSKHPDRNEEVQRGAEKKSVR